MATPDDFASGPKLYCPDGSIVFGPDGSVIAVGGGGGGPTSGDVSGTLPGPYTVVGIQGDPVANTAPAAGEFLGWNGAAWEALPLPASGVQTVGAVAPVLSSGGANPSISLAAGANVGDVYSWNGAAWDTAERVLRVAGVNAPAGDLGATSAAGNVIVNSLNGETRIRSFANSSMLSVVGSVVLAAANATGAVVEITGTGETLYLGAAVARTTTINPVGGNLVRWESTITSLQEDIEATAAGAGAVRTLRSQDSTAGAGGVLDLRSGDGSTVPGDVTLRIGATTALSIAGSTGRVTIGQEAFAGTHQINSSVSTSATAGGADALPSPPAGYLDIDINGAQQRIPYYNP